MADQSLMRLLNELGLPTFEMFNVTHGNVSSQEEHLDQLDGFMSGVDMFATALLLNSDAKASAYYNRQSLMKGLLSRLFPKCQLPMHLSPIDWPLLLEENDDLNVLIEVMPNLPVPSDPFERAYYAYSTWCNPVMCSKVTEKGTYLRTMQGMAVFGGLWGIISLAILVLWQCLFLGCLVGHQQQKANTQAPRTPRTAISAFLGIGSVRDATPADARVEVEPQMQSMDRAAAADAV